MPPAMARMAGATTSRAVRDSWVLTATPPTRYDSGNWQKTTKKRAATAGKMP